MSLPFSKEKLGVSDSKTPSAQAPGRGNTKTKAKNLNVAYAIWFAAFALGFLCPNNLGDTTASLVFGSSGTRSLRTSQQEDHPRDEGSRSSKDRVDQIALKSMQEPPVPLQPKISIKDEPKTTVAVFYHIDEDVTSSGIAGQVRETIRRVGQTAGATSSDTNWVLHYDISRDVQQSITVHTVDAFCQDFKQQLTCYHSEQDVSSIARSSQKYGKHIFGLERMHAFCQEDSRLSDVVVYIHNGQANEILDASLKPECIRSVLRQKSAIDNERPSCDTCGRHFDPTLGYQGNIFSSRYVVHSW
mmetsp:Transcript_32486/g.67728  ORF Transcript_32486/g.67728 Transcript_32486/m.67728 type:complete len:301 (-) Transcript_32486:1646-2548(-)